MPKIKRIRVSKKSRSKPSRSNPPARPGGRRKRNAGEGDVEAFLQDLNDVCNEHGIAIDDPQLEYLEPNEVVDYSAE